ncbi:MAG: PAS domain S-box protein [Thermodesulfobacteriota bacterium]
MNQSDQNIGARLIFPLGLAWVILLGISLFSVYRLQTLRAADQMREKLSGVHHVYAMRLMEDTRLLDSMVEFLKRDENLQRAWLARDRNRLLAYSRQLFDGFLTNHGVTHLYFVDPDRVCFLRVHSPSKFGDTLRGFTMDTAARDGKPSHGLEFGPLGALAFRNVHPWRINGELSGYIEVGLELKQLSDELSKALGLELAIALNVHYLDAAKFTDAPGPPPPSHEHGDFTDFVFTKLTLEKPPSGLQDLVKSHHAGKKIEYQTSSDGRSYGLGFVPLTDARNRTLGYLVVMNDITQLRAEVRSLSLILVVIGLLVGAGLGGVFYLYLGRIDRRLGASRNRLAAEIEDRKSIQHALQTNLQFLTTLLNTIPNPIFYCNTRGEYQGCNTAFHEQIIGLPKDLIVGRTIGDVSEACGRDVSYFCNDMSIDCLSERGGRSCVSNIECADGIHRDFLLSKASFGDDLCGFAGNVVVMLDLTDRKSAEEAVQRSHEEYRLLYEESRRTEEIYRTILNSTPDAIVMYDLEGGTQYVNEAFTRTFGWVLEEIKGQHMPYVPDSEKETTELRLERIVREGVVESGFETKRLTKDGSLLDVSISASRYNNHEGNPAGTLVALRDITDHKRTQELLKSEKERLHSLSEQAPFGMVIIGNDGRFRYLNSEFQRLFGYDLDDVSDAGQWLKRAFPDPEYRRQVRASWNAYVTGADTDDTMARYFSVTCKDGTEKAIQFKAVRLSSGEYLMTCEDITELRKTQMAIAQTQQKFRDLYEESKKTHELYRSLLDSTPDAVVVYDASGFPRYLNNAFTVTFGWTFDEVRGRRIPFVPDSEAETTATAIRRIFVDGESVSGLETRRLTKDGRRLDIHLSASKYNDHAGNTAGMVVILRDISDLKQVERELVQARKVAEGASRAKSEFLANMSHEIRTPINGIMGMTELALNTQLTAEQYEYLDAVRVSADSLLKLINDILDFSKIEAGKFDLIDVDFALRDTLSDAMTILGVQAHKKGVELIYHVPPEIPDGVIGDPGRLRQILINLVGNAIKFTDKGEVAVSVRSELRTEKETVLHFSVRDTGIGIPKDKQHSIFRAFEQADGSTSRNYGGTGLGLAITSRFCELMGGEIWVESEPGQGSTFHFTVPFKLAPEAPQPSVLPDMKRLKDLPVLVVDDNATNRQVLEQVLLYWEMSPTVVDSGKAALAATQKACQEGRPFALVITDCMMPEMDGFELVERLNEAPGVCPSTVIMLTSSGERGDASRCLKLGISAYLMKPIKQAELLMTISRVLQEPSSVNARPTLVTRHSIREVKRRLRILLAEDNLVNQKLAKRMVEKMGHEVTVARHGQEALQILEQGGFDLILMDVQMPMMDGLDATRAIRDRERDAGGHIPIIAMTAYAMAGDKEKCLEAGMDGYLSKPINAKAVFQKIEEVTVQCREGVCQAPVSHVYPEAIGKNRILERAGGDPALLREVLDLFLIDSPKLLTEIREAFEQNDPDRMGKAAITLKGSVGNFAASGAEQAALRVETVAKFGDLEQAPQAILNLEKEIDRVREELLVLQQRIEA